MENLKMINEINNNQNNEDVPFDADLLPDMPEDNTLICDHCGCVINEDEDYHVIETNFDDKTYCQSCTDRLHRKHSNRYGKLLCLS